MHIWVRKTNNYLIEVTSTHLVSFIKDPIPNIEKLRVEFGPRARPPMDYCSLRWKFKWYMYTHIILTHDTILLKLIFINVHTEFTHSLILCKAHYFRCSPPPLIIIMMILYSYMLSNHFPFLFWSFFFPSIIITCLFLLNFKWFLFMLDWTCK